MVVLFKIPAGKLSHPPRQSFIFVAAVPQVLLRALCFFNYLITPFVFPIPLFVSIPSHRHHLVSFIFFLSSLCLSIQLYVELFEFLKSLLALYPVAIDLQCQY